MKIDRTLQHDIDDIEEMQKSFYRSMVSISGELCTPSQKIDGGVNRAAYEPFMFNN